MGSTASSRPGARSPACYPAPPTPPRGRPPPRPNGWPAPCPEPPGGRSGPPERLDHLGDGLVRILDAGDEPVRIGAGERRRLRPPRRHQHGNLTQRRAVQLRLVHRVVAAVVVDLLTGEQAMDDAQRLRHALDPLGVAGERETHRALVDVLAGAHTEHEPTSAEPVDGGGRLGDQGRVVVEERAGDAGGELDPLGPHRRRPQPAPHEPGGGHVVHPGMEVVGAEDDVEADLFGEDCLVDQDLGLVRLVAAQPRELHGGGSTRRRHPVNSPWVSRRRTR